MNSPDFLTSHLHCIASKSESFPLFTHFHRQLRISMARVDSAWMVALYGKITSRQDAFLNLIFLVSLAALRYVSIDNGVHSIWEGLDWVVGDGRWE